MARLEKWIDLWKRGAIALLVIVLAVAAVGVLIALSAGVLLNLAFGFSEEALWPWFILSAAIWAPPAIATALTYLRDDLPQSSESGPGWTAGAPRGSEL